MANKVSFSGEHGSLEDMLALDILGNMELHEN